MSFFSFYFRTWALCGLAVGTAQLMRLRFPRAIVVPLVTWTIKELLSLIADLEAAIEKSENDKRLRKMAERVKGSWGP